MPRALISVSDKTGLVPFARGLAARGFELVSTGGTAKTLQDNGLPVVNVSDVTGFPEMMDGRVKTLHPRIHGGILARRAVAPHLAAAREHGIGLIDVVAVNLYPFAAAAANPATPFEGLVEEIDIGGPSLVRGAAKNFADVLVVVSPADYAAVLEELDRPGGPSRAFRFDLARQGVRAHRGLRHGHRRDACRRDGGGAGASRAAAGRRRRAPVADDDRRCRRSGTCATARTRTSRRRGTRKSRATALGARRVAAGQGTVVHEPARPRRRRAHRARVRRAGRRRDQAHQPVRRRHRDAGRRRLRARARGRPAVGVRRHRRASTARSTPRRRGARVARSSTR